MKKPSIIVVMPAYNAEKTLQRTIADIPKGFATRIILVDDASKDRTKSIGEKLGLKVYAHQNNLGYGGNQKTCYWEAMKYPFDAVVMLHPDYQYDATQLPKLVAPILAGEYDVMIGSRIRTRKEALDGGMPLIKYLLNRFMTTVENMVLGVNLSEHLSGLRAYSPQTLQTVPFQRFSNDFVFDQQFFISAISHGLRIGEIPVPVRYFSEASSIGYLKGAVFIAETCWYLFLYVLHQTPFFTSSLYRNPRTRAPRPNPKRRVSARQRDSTHSE